MKAKKVVGEELDEVESDLKFPPFRGLHTLLLLSLSFISLSLTAENAKPQPKTPKLYFVTPQFAADRSVGHCISGLKNKPTA